MSRAIGSANRTAARTAATSRSSASTPSNPAADNASPRDGPASSADARRRTDERQRGEHRRHVQDHAEAGDLVAGDAAGVARDHLQPAVAEAVLLGAGSGPSPWRQRWVLRACRQKASR